MKALVSIFAGDKLKSDLLQQIEQGQIKPQQAILSERKLAKKYGINYKTVRRVIGELAEQGLLYRHTGKGTFVTDPSRRMPISHNTKDIVVFLPFASDQLFTDQFYGEVWKGMEEEASSDGYHLLYVSFPDKGMSGTFPQLMQTNRLCGALSVCDGGKGIVSFVKDRQIPMVLVDYPPTDNSASYVVTDNLNGAFEAAEYLINLGHKRIGCISTPGPGTSYAERVEGYKKALQKHNLNPNNIHTTGQFNGKIDERVMFKHGYTSAKKMPKSSFPTAIFCVSDMIALGAMKAITEKGLRIPQDISIIGFDDIPSSAYAHPSLTTVKVDKKKMGKLAVRTLLEMFKDASAKQVVISTQLMIRQSCLSPSKKKGEERCQNIGY